MFLCGIALGQATQGIRGHVVDAAGSAVAGAEIAVAGVVVTHTGADGNLSLANAASGATMTVTFRGLQAVVPSSSGAEIEIVLRASPVEQNAVVTTTRSSIDLGSPANTVSTINRTELTQYPALTLDERLR